MTKIAFTLRDEERGSLAIRDIKRSLLRTRLLHFTTIAGQVRHHPDADGYTILTAFVQSSRITKKLLLQSIRGSEQRERFLHLEQAYLLFRDNQLSRDLFNVLLACEYPLQVAKGFLAFHRVNCLSEDLMNALMKTQEPSSLTTTVLNIKKEDPTLSEDQIFGIIKHLKPLECVKAICHFKEKAATVPAENLNSIIDMIITHPSTNTFTPTLCWMHQNNILTLKNCKALHTWQDLPSSFLQDLITKQIICNNTADLQTWFDALLIQYHGTLLMSEINQNPPIQEITATSAHTIMAALNSKTMTQSKSAGLTLSDNTPSLDSTEILVQRALAEQDLEGTVRTVLMSHLMTMRNNDEKLNLASLHQMADGGPIDESLWNSVKEKVADELFRGYGATYNNQREHPDFVLLINQGQRVNTAIIAQKFLFPLSRRSALHHPEPTIPGTIEMDHRGMQF